MADRNLHNIDDEERDVRQVHFKRLPVKRKKSRFILLYAGLLVAVLFCMVLLHTCGDDGKAGVAEVQETPGDTLRVAIIHSPLSYYIYGDTIGGLNYDLLRQMSADLGIPVKFVPVVSLDRSLHSLREGKVDMLASMPMTADMRKHYLFTDGVYLDRQVLVQKRLANGKLSASSVLDLAGETIHIEKNPATAERLRNMADEIGADVITVEHPDLSDEYLFLKVLSGDFRYAVINGETAQRLVEKHPEVSTETQTGFTQFQSWLFRRKSVATANKINAWLSNFKETQEYRDLLKRYHIDDDASSNSAHSEK